jgi:hypothetical protein
MARPQHQPTDEQRRQVMTLAGLGITQDQIANLLHLAPKTLRLRYRNELDTGTTEANIRVARSLFNMATKEGNVAAQIFWLKVRAGWREQQAVNIGGTDRPVGIDLTWAPTRPPVSTEVSTIDAETEDEDAEAGDAVVTWDGEKAE